MPKPDMTLAVNVAVTGSIDSNNQLNPTATYTQGTTVPASTNVVDSKGNINLKNMSDSNNNYSNQTDITFMLSGTITDQNGNSYGVVYPDTVAKAIDIQEKGGGGHGQLVPSLASETSLFVDDSDQDGQDYTYCLTVEPNMISADGVPTCALDPTIVNR
jgi:hypothetical protein